MQYSFEILGISPIVHFFSHQAEIISKQNSIAYLGSQRCTIDAFIDSVHYISPREGWNFHDITNTMIQFWLNNSSQIQYWKSSLDQAGTENILVARLANFTSLQQELETIFNL